MLTSRHLDNINHNEFIFFLLLLKLLPLHGHETVTNAFLAVLIFAKFLKATAVYICCNTLPRSRVCASCVLTRTTFKFPTLSCRPSDSFTRCFRGTRVHSAWGRLRSAPTGRRKASGSEPERWNGNCLHALCTRWAATMLTSVCVRAHTHIYGAREREKGGGSVVGGVEYIWMVENH